MQDDDEDDEEDDVEGQPLPYPVLLLVQLLGLVLVASVAGLPLIIVWRALEVGRGRLTLVSLQRPTAKSD